MNEVSSADPSTIAASTTWPRPDRSRSSSAARMPSASSMPPPPKSPSRLTGGTGRSPAPPAPQPRVRLGPPPGPNPEPLAHAGPDPLHERVGGLDEPQQQLDSRGIFEVDPDRPAATAQRSGRGGGVGAA